MGVISKHLEGEENKVQYSKNLPATITLYTPYKIDCDQNVLITVTIWPQVSVNAILSITSTKSGRFVVDASETIVESKYINYPSKAVTYNLTDKEFPEIIPYNLTNKNICLFTHKRQEKEQALRNKSIQENKNFAKKQSRFIISIILFFSLLNIKINPLESRCIYIERSSPPLLAMEETPILI